MLLLGLSAGCGRDILRAETEGGLEVALAVEPSPPRAGDVGVTATILDRQGAVVEGALVRFFYWMPYKGVPASAEQQVKVVEGSSGDGRYIGTVRLEKPGPWKIAVKVERPKREPDLATFTVTVGG